MWFVYALLCAMSLSTTDAFCKRTLSTSSTYVVAWVRWAYSLPFLLPLLLFIDIPQLDRQFWLAVAINIPLEIAAILLYIQALKVSPLSLTVPFLALTPVLLIPTSFLILGESVTRGSFIGILLVSFGAYMLNISSTAEGKARGLIGSFAEPFRAVSREKGSLLMIVVAAIYSVTSVFVKIAIQHSSPIFFVVFYLTVLSLALSFIVIVKEREGLFYAIRHPEEFLHIGAFNGLMFLFHFIALKSAAVSYVISVKRTSMIFSVLYGWAWFGERGVIERLVGATIMALGVALIAFS